MAHALKQRGADYELVYAGRTRSAMAFLDQLQDDHAGRLRVVVGAESGRLDCGALVAGLRKDTELYVCGPPALLTEAQRQWREADRPPGLLRFETFGSGGAAPTLPFEIHVPRTGTRAAVPAEQSALDALQAVGAEALYDCLRGECGLCVVPVLASEKPIDHRDVFLSPQQKSLDDQICLCVSRIPGGALSIELP
jgi:ferredoxin